MWNGCWLFSNSTLSRYNSTQTSCKFSLNKGYISWKKSTWPGCTISKAERTWNEGRLILVEGEIHLCTPTGNRKKEASSDDRLTMNSNGNFTTKQGKNLNLRCYVWKNTTFLVPCKPFSRTWDFGRRWAFSSKRPSFHFSDLSQTWMSV